MRDSFVVIVGAGMAGLSCASKCQEYGLEYVLIDQSKRVGGRVGSIVENGYIFDLGFQVYNTSYTITNSFLDDSQIRLKTFKPGARIHDGLSFKIISDPMRDPGEFFSTLFSRLTNFSDKLRIIYLKNSLSGYSIESDYSPDSSTMDYLRTFGFSEIIIKNFFRPFFSGIFLENSLETSSKFFKLIFSKFSSGLAALPYNGMQAIPDSFLNNIGEKNILLGQKVRSIDNKNKIYLDSGQTIRFNHLVLTGKSVELVKLFNIEYNFVKTLYFSSKIIIEKGKYIHLFPYDDLINNIAILSSVSGNYTSNSDHLLSVTVLNCKLSQLDLIRLIKPRLSKYFNIDKDAFGFLKLIDIKQATIKQPPGFFDLQNYSDNGAIISGDFTKNGSIEGAVASGIDAAEKIKNQMK